jgi:hypothetical protein
LSFTSSLSGHIIYGAALGLLMRYASPVDKV